MWENAAIDADDGVALKFPEQSSPHVTPHVVQHKIPKSEEARIDSMMEQLNAAKARVPKSYTWEDTVDQYNALMGTTGWHTTTHKLQFP